MLFIYMYTITKLNIYITYYYEFMELYELSVEKEQTRTAASNKYLKVKFKMKM